MPKNALFLLKYKNRQRWGSALRPVCLRWLEALPPSPPLTSGSWGLCPHIPG